jgi:hypothetical protein
MILSPSRSRNGRYSRHAFPPMHAGREIREIVSRFLDYKVVERGISELNAKVRQGQRAE